ncbi:hypothetical protein [Streptomyces hydrogenans]|uniref:hypothetical protein n=1 Tax=Streptomyces hydrogenans TaxID=1873719 RepID=UPI003318677E
MPAWVVAVPAAVLAVLASSFLSPLFVSIGPPALEVADVEGVWTEEGGDGRLTLYADGTAELAGFEPAAVCAAGLTPTGARPVRVTWDFGDGDDPRMVWMRLSGAETAGLCRHAYGLDVAGSGRRAELFGRLPGSDDDVTADFVREGVGSG